ncbi:MAG: hypothetical protein U9R44_07915 [Candidatus Omnitrophota bacterium]|nr:hypothetical protein [Candidatus Omnitrophota bacterium]
MNKRKEEIMDAVEKLKMLGVEKIGPAHCSGEEAADVFRKRFGENYIPIAAGKVFEV